MRRQDLTAERQDYLVHPPGREHVWALVAPPSPRRLDIDPRREAGLAAAHRALGRLQEALTRIPNTDMVTRTLARREAVMSSQIEGTRSDLPQLFTYEATNGESNLPPDVRVTECYVRALNYGLERVRATGKTALTLGLIHELHSLLMHDDARVLKGKYRTDQVWIGAGRIEDAKFVPTPPERIAETMAEFEENALRYAPREDELTSLSLVAHLALTHAQFETIHPYADGNGRTGRILLPLIMAAEGLPPLYVSGTLLARKAEYYDSLASVQLRGDWNPWVALLSAAIVESSDDAISIATDLLALAERWEAKLERLRSHSAARRLPRFLIGHPVLSVDQVASGLGISKQAANTAVRALWEEGIVEPVDERRRGRLFRAREVLERVSRHPEEGNAK